MGVSSNILDLHLLSPVSCLADLLSNVTDDYSYENKRISDKKSDINRGISDKNKSVDRNRGISDLFWSESM